MAISPGDIDAALDVVTQLLEEIDDLDASGAIAMRERIHALQAKAKLADELLEARAVNSLDGQPAVVDGKVWVASSKGTGKWRPLHGKIKALIIDRAVEMATDKSTGEMTSPREAVREAVEMTFDAFVSPTSMPKQGFLGRQSVSNKDIAVYERGRKKLTSIEVEPEVDDE